jgi:hypothetical protein
MSWSADVCDCGAEPPRGTATLLIALGTDEPIQCDIGTVASLESLPDLLEAVAAEMRRNVA